MSDLRPTPNHTPLKYRCSIKIYYWITWNPGLKSRSKHIILDQVKWRKNIEISSSCIQSQSYLTFIEDRRSSHPITAPLKISLLSVTFATFSSNIQYNMQTTCNKILLQWELVNRFVCSKQVMQHNHLILFGYQHTSGEQHSLTIW